MVEMIERDESDDEFKFDFDTKCMTYLQNNKDYVNCIATIYESSGKVDPNNPEGLKEKKVAIYDYVNKKTIATFIVHKDLVEKCSIYPAPNYFIHELSDGSVLSCDGKNMCRWTFTSGELLTKIWRVQFIDGEIKPKMIELSNEMVVLYGGKNLYIFDVDTGVGYVLSATDYHEEEYEDEDFEGSVSIMDIAALGNTSFAVIFNTSLILIFTLNMNRETEAIKVRCKSFDPPISISYRSLDECYTISSYMKNGVADKIAILSADTVYLFQFPNWELCWEHKYGDSRYQGQPLFKEESGHLDFSACGLFLTCSSISPCYVHLFQVETGAHLCDDILGPYKDNNFLKFHPTTNGPKVLTNVYGFEEKQELKMVYFRPIQSLDTKIASLLSQTKSSDLAYDGDSVLYKLFQNIKKKLI